MVGFGGGVAGGGLLWWVAGRGGRRQPWYNSYYIDSSAEQYIKLSGCTDEVDTSKVEHRLCLIYKPRKYELDLKQYVKNWDHGNKQLSLDTRYCLRTDLMFLSSITAQSELGLWFESRLYLLLFITSVCVVWVHTLSFCSLFLRKGQTPTELG